MTRGARQTTGRRHTSGCARTDRRTADPSRARPTAAGSAAVSRTRRPGCRERSPDRIRLAPARVSGPRPGAHVQGAQAFPSRLVHPAPGDLRRTPTWRSTVVDLRDVDDRIGGRGDRRELDNLAVCTAGGGRCHEREGQHDLARIDALAVERISVEALHDRIEDQCPLRSATRDSVVGSPEWPGAPAMRCATPRCFLSLIAPKRPWRSRRRSRSNQEYRRPSEPSLRAFPWAPACWGASTTQSSTRPFFVISSM